MFKKRIMLGILILANENYFVGHGKTIILTDTFFNKLPLKIKIKGFIRSFKKYGVEHV